jgi:hypothetical protein
MNPLGIFIGLVIALFWAGVARWLYKRLKAESTR